MLFEWTTRVIGASGPPTDFCTNQTTTASSGEARHWSGEESLCRISVCRAGFSRLAIELSSHWRFSVQTNAVLKSHLSVTWAAAYLCSELNLCWPTRFSRRKFGTLTFLPVVLCPFRLRKPPTYGLGVVESFRHIFPRFYILCIIIYYSNFLPNFLVIWLFFIQNVFFNLFERQSTHFRSCFEK